MSIDFIDIPTAGELPRPLTSLIGREQEVEEVGALLRRDNVRLVTLTGPGGVGKTRLAIEAARPLSSDFKDGAVFVSLAAVTDPSFAIEAMAQAFGITAISGEPTGARLRDALRDTQTLLVIDNFEHVAGAAPELTMLLGECPLVRIVVTSRVRLRLSGEWEYEVGPLALPQPSQVASIQDALHIASIQLFVQRSSAADFRFTLNEDNVSAVEEICRRLGGLPLAIELAAARVKFLPPNAMIGQLQNNLAMLKGGGPDTPARHRTMSDAIRWSYELLSPLQKRVFRTIAVFVGSFTLDAAASVLHRTHSEDSRDVEIAIESLVEQSLLRVIESGESQPRFSMLEPLRDFAAEALESKIVSDVIRDAHAQYFLEFVERGSPYFGPGRVAKVQEVEREIENIYASLGWLVEHNRAEPALRLANALIFNLWQPRGRIHEQLIWLQRVIEMPGDGLEPERAGAYVGLGLAETRSGNFDAAFLAVEEALSRARASENREKLTWALIGKGILSWRTGKLDEAQTLLENALAFAQRLDDRFLLGWTHHNLALTAANSGDVTQATSHFEEAHAILQALGDPWELADLEGNLAGHLDVIGEIARSAELERHVVKEFQRLGDAWLMQFSLFSAGSHAAAIGMCAQAVRILSAMAQLGRQTGTAVPFGYEELYDSELGRAREQLEVHEFAVAWSAGETMTMDAAVAEADEVFAAWGETEASGPALSTPLHSLSPREIEVLRLVAAGKSNRQIGEELFISVPTVKVHVRSIMGKLELDSRTALAAFAIRHQLD